MRQSGLLVLAWIFGNTVLQTLFAQTTDPLGGTAGWVGTGLLGAVLSWLLLVRLPANDKQIKDLMDSRDQLTKEMAEKHAAQMKELALSFGKQIESTMTAYEQNLREKRQDFKENLDRVIAASREETVMLNQTLQSRMQESDQVILDVRRTLEDFRTTILEIEKRNKIEKG